MTSLMVKGPPPGSVSAGGQPLDQGASTAHRTAPLTETVSPSAVLSTQILRDPAVVAKLPPLLPPGQQTESQLGDNLRSPQVRQALSTLHSAIAGSSFNSVLVNFSLSTTSQKVQDAMNGGDMVLAFLEAVNDSVEKK